MTIAPNTGQLKIIAHQKFDPIWQARPALTDRATAYALLATIIGVSEPEAHMKVMDRQHLLMMPYY